MSVAVGLALVLSLPESMADRELLIVMAFGVVLFTLLGQGTTMQFLLRRLKLVKRSLEDLEYERQHGRLMAARAARDRLKKMDYDSTLSAATWERLSPILERRIDTLLRSQKELLDKYPTLQVEELDDARREGLRAQRASLAALLRDGLISENVYDELVAEVDAALDSAAMLMDEELQLPEDT